VAHEKTTDVQSCCKLIHSFLPDTFWLSRTNPSAYRDSPCSEAGIGCEGALFGKESQLPHLFLPKVPMRTNLDEIYEIHWEKLRYLRLQWSSQGPKGSQRNRFIGTRCHYSVAVSFSGPVLPRSLVVGNLPSYYCKYLHGELFVVDYRKQIILHACSHLGSNRVWVVASHVSLQFSNTSPFPKPTTFWITVPRHWGFLQNWHTPQACHQIRRITSTDTLTDMIWEFHTNPSFHGENNNMDFFTKGICPKFYTFAQCSTQKQIWSSVGQAAAASVFSRFTDVMEVLEADDICLPRGTVRWQMPWDLMVKLWTNKCLGFFLGCFRGLMNDKEGVGT
jgi:hypothetical protein